MSVIVVPARDVLVDTYRVRQFAIFGPTEVAGLPATNEQPDVASTSCSTTVGTALEQGFIVNYDGSGAAGDGGPASCAQSQRIAERIVASLPPQAGK